MNREYHFRVRGNAEPICEILSRLEGEIQTPAP